MFHMRMRTESGTCNVCSAPCSSCMHYRRSLLATGSKSESGFSSNMSSRRKADSSCLNADGTPIPKSISFADLQNSETSILLSTSSSHDSYSENAESKANPRSCMNDASDAFDKHQAVSSSEAVDEECSLLRNPAQDCAVSQVPASDDLCHRFHSGQGEVQSGFECHGENILLTFGDRDVNSASCYQKAGSLPSNTENETTSFLNDESKDMEGILNLQCKVNAAICAGESPLASLAARSSSKYRDNALKNHEGLLLSQTRNLLSSCNSKTNDLSQKVRKGSDSGKQFDSNSVESGVQDIEIYNATLDAFNGQAGDLQAQVIPDGGQSNMDAVLDDVKVCDICGDAGREDLLATCSRCNDGAEHTYCMQEKMDKVPEGDWLCEECKIKDMGNREMDEPEAASGIFKTTFRDEIIHKHMSTFIPQKLPKLEAKPTYLNSQGLTKGMQSPHISRRQVDRMVEGNDSEVSDSIEQVIPRKRLTFSRQVSVKGQDSCKMKTVAPSLKVQSTKDPEAVPISKTYLRSNSFKCHSNIHSPRGILSRSASFSNLNIKPNVKKSTENELYKKKNTKESISNDLRKLGLVKQMSKTSSFKSTALVCPSTDSASKSSFNSPRLEENKRPKELLERNSVEKKSFSKVDNSFSRSSTAIASIHPLNVDSKSLQSNFKINNGSKTGVWYLGKESDDKNDLGTDEGKKQIMYTSKAVGSSSENFKFENPKKSKVPKDDTSASIMDGSWHKADIASHNTVAPPDLVRSKTIDSEMVINSRSSALDDDQALHSQKCNGAGNTAQSYSIHKFQDSSCKPTPESNLIEVGKKRNKWIELVDAARTLKNKQIDKIESLPSDKIVEMMSEASSKLTPTASCQTNVPLVVDSNKAEESSKDFVVHPIKPLVSQCSDQPTLFPLDASSVEKPYGLNEISAATQLNIKYFAESLQGFFFKQLNPSAVPKLEYIWQGSFNVHRSGNPPELFNGIQAHISACASHKVSEVAANVPCNFQLEEVSHTSSWPLQFQGISPHEENIALFFFAKDMQSYDRSYKELVERMRRNDSALKGNIDGTELLIFTSIKLPLNSQCWNSMHYLWGMFRVKRSHGLSMMATHKQSSLSNMNADLISQDFSTCHAKSVPNGTNKSETSPKLSESASIIMIPGESADGMDDLHYIASNIGHKKCRTSGSSTVRNGLNQHNDNPKVTEEQLSFPVGNSSGNTAQPPRIVDIPQSGPQLCKTKSRCEEKSNGIYQNKIDTNSMHWKTGESPARPCDVDVESDLLIASSMVPPASQNCNQGGARSSINRLVEEMESSPCPVAEHKGDALETDRFSCEPSSSRKHGRSCSAERVLQPLGEFLNSAETELTSGRASWMHVACETERKKTCYPGSRSPSDKNTSTRLSSKVHPIHSSISTWQEHGEFSCSRPATTTNTRTAEMCFFPVDVFPGKNKDLWIDIMVTPSTDDDDTPDSSALDLELALGRKSTPQRKPALSTFPVGSGRLGHHDLLGDDGVHASASLSLSLSSPPSESQIPYRRILKAEQVALFRPGSFS